MLCIITTMKGENAVIIISFGENCDIIDIVI